MPPLPPLLPLLPLVRLLLRLRVLRRPAREDEVMRDIIKQLWTASTPLQARKELLLVNAPAGPITLASPLTL